MWFGLTPFRFSGAQAGGNGNKPAHTRQVFPLDAPTPGGNMSKDHCASPTSLIDESLNATNVNTR